MNTMHRRRPAELLLVEDNQGDVRLVRETFSQDRSHVNIHVASDGVEALAFLRGESNHENPCPDLVLLDLNLPRKDGRQVLEEMKRDPELRRIPVVVLTTSEAQSDVRHAYDLNANCYVTKPIELDDFMAVVRDVERFWLNIAHLPTD